MRCRIASLFVTLAIAFGAVASPAHAEDVPLGAPAGFIASSVSRVAEGRYCISGRTVDEAGPTNTAWVALVDVGARQVVWKTSLPFSRPYVGNYALYCVRALGAYYVLTQEQTHWQASMNQAKIAINKLGGDGRLLARQPVNVGFEEWAYLLDSSGESIAVAGGTSNELNRKGALATYVAHFNTTLDRTDLFVIPSGAFWVDTNAAISGGELRVAGQFIPSAEGLTGAHEGFVVSRIDLEKRRYLSSTYISPPDERARASVFGADGTAYYVATTPAELVVTVVAPSGKLVQHFTTHKIICDITSIGSNGKTIDVIGKTCDKPSASTLATIDLTNQSAALTRGIAGDISAAAFDGETWVGVVHTDDRDLVLRRAAR